MNYHNDLRKAKWLEKKGLIMKILDKTVIEKTDMGTELEKMHTAYAAVDWNLGAKQAYKTLAAIDTDEDELPERFKLVTAYHTAVTAMHTHATGVKTILAASKLVPSGVKDYVNFVIAKTVEYDTDLKKITLAGLTKSYEDAKTKFRANQKIATAALSAWIPKIKTGLTTVKSHPTGQNYNDHLWQAVRGFAASVGNFDFIKDLQPEWKALSSVQPTSLHDKTPDQEKTKVKAHLTKIETLVGETEPLMPH